MIGINNNAIDYHLLQKVGKTLTYIDCWVAADGTDSGCREFQN